MPFVAGISAKSHKSHSSSSGFLSHLFLRIHLLFRKCSCSFYQRSYFFLFHYITFCTILFFGWLMRSTISNLDFIYILNSCFSTDSSFYKDNAFVKFGSACQRRLINEAYIREIQIIIWLIHATWNVQEHSLMVFVVLEAHSLADKSLTQYNKPISALAINDMLNCHFTQHALLIYRRMRVCEFNWWI